MDYIWHLLISLLVVAASATASISKSSTLARVEDEDYRLPNNTVPLDYDIKLIPYLDVGNFTFDGEVTISVTVIAQTTTIVLHAHELNIANVSVTSGNVTYPIANETYNSELHFYTLTFATTLASGNYSIYAKYTGTLDDDMNGFYRSSYTTATGETR